MFGIGGAAFQESGQTRRFLPSPSDYAGRIHSELNDQKQSFSIDTETSAVYIWDRSLSLFNLQPDDHRIGAVASADKQEQSVGGGPRSRPHPCFNLWHGNRYATTQAPFPANWAMRLGNGAPHIESMQQVPPMCPARQELES